MWKLESGIGIHIWNRNLELEFRTCYWNLESEIASEIWNLELECGIGTQNSGISDLEFRMWNDNLELGFGIETLEVELGFGIEPRIFFIGI